MSRVECWVSIMYRLLTLLILVPVIAFAASQDAERFTHIAGVNLSDLPALEELQKIFGTGSITESGDAGDYDARICYRTSDEKAVVEFFHGEVNWGFVLRIPEPHDDKCPISKELEARGLSISEISLGMDEAKYRQIMGKPNKETSNSLEHYFKYVHTLTDTELKQMVERNRKNGYPPSNPEDLRRWDVGIYISAIFTKGHLTSFTVNRSTETN